LKGAQTVYHLAAKVALEGPWEEFQRDTLDATARILRIAQEEKVPVFVLCGTEACLLGDRPLINADETWPYAQTPAGPYSKSKGIQEAMVLKANAPGFRTVSIRPRFIWGRDDTTLGPGFAAQMKAGKFLWIGGGDYYSSTTHVDNTCEGLIKGAKAGKGGEAYFVLDAKPVHLRTFVTEYVKCFGADLSEAWSVPSFIAFPANALGLGPAFSRFFWGETCTISDAKARRDIGYEGKVTVEEGMRQLRELKEKERQEGKEVKPAKGFV
jgi:nucleoside-diphosphate-sugar epimerase